jgi:amino acid transporter
METEISKKERTNEIQKYYGGLNSIANLIIVLCCGNLCLLLATIFIYEIDYENWTLELAQTWELAARFRYSMPQWVLLTMLLIGGFMGRSFRKKTPSSWIFVGGFVTTVSYVSLGFWLSYELTSINILEQIVSIIYLVVAIVKYRAYRKEAKRENNGDSLV